MSKQIPKICVEAWFRIWVLWQESHTSTMTQCSLSCWINKPFVSSILMEQFHLLSVLRSKIGWSQCSVIPFRVHWMTTLYQIFVLISWGIQDESTLFLKQKLMKSGLPLNPSPKVTFPNQATCFWGRQKLPSGGQPPRTRSSSQQQS